MKRSGLGLLAGVIMGACIGNSIGYNNGISKHDESIDRVNSEISRVNGYLSYQAYQLSQKGMTNEYDIYRQIADSISSISVPKRVNLRR